MALSQWDAVVEAPFGRLGLRAEQDRLIEVEFLSVDAPLKPPVGGVTARAAVQLAAYFNDAARPFELPLGSRGTVFQERVWEALRAIPAGQTRTYGELARQLGSSARAVGGACRANPLAVVVPCHRVLAAGGFGGFAGARAGAALDIKRWLLAHEGADLPSNR